MCSRKVTQEGPLTASGARLWTVPGASTLIDSPRGRSGLSVRFSAGKGKSLYPGLCSAAVSRQETVRLSPASSPALVSGFFLCGGAGGHAEKRKLARKGTTAGSVLGHEPFPAACLTTSGSLHATRAPAGTQFRAHLDKSPQEEIGTHLDHNWVAEDAIAQSGYTECRPCLIQAAPRSPRPSLAVRAPGDESSLDMDFMSRVTDGPWNTEHVHASSWPPGDGRLLSAETQRPQHSGKCRLLPTSGVSTSELTTAAF